MCLWGKIITNMLNQAIILAGGKGQRLRPFTDKCPKGMIKVEGKPILEYQIEWLKSYGVAKVIFACGYLSNIIKEYFKDGKEFGVEIQYSLEDEPLGRGGAIKKAWELIKNNNPVVVMNGDIYTEMDLGKVVDTHMQLALKNGDSSELGELGMQAKRELLSDQLSKVRIIELENWKEQGILGSQSSAISSCSILATICLFPYKSPYGVVKVDDSGIIESFQEKRQLPYWVNGGIYIFENEVKNYLPDFGDHETSTFPQLADKKLLYGYKSLDFWRGIDTVKDLNEVASDIRELSMTIRQKNKNS